MKKAKSYFTLLIAIILGFAACNYHGDTADSSSSSNETPSGPSSSSGAASTINNNAVNPSLTDTLFSDKQEIVYSLKYSALEKQFNR